MKPTIKNATIEKAYITLERGSFITMSLQLAHEDGHQVFAGGYNLYNVRFPYVGYLAHFVARAMQLTGVDNFNQLPGKNIRILSDDSRIYRIGHIYKDDWFDPDADIAMSKDMDQ